MDRLRTIIKSSPFIIALIYVLVGVLWIQYSDQMVLSLFGDSHTITRIQSLKGWFYVIASGVLIFFLVYKSNELIDNLFKDVKKSRNQFESTFEFAPVGIAHHKPNENWILVNRSLCSLLGYSKKELLSLNFEDFIHPNDLERGRKLDQDIINGEISSYKTEKKYRRKDGTYFIGQVTKSAVYDENNNALYLIAIVEDISQQKENEIKLKESLEEKEILLSEVHHRVKNNIALMSALLELQQMYTKKSDLTEVLQHYKTRLKTLSIIYENFTGKEKEPTIDFTWYLHEQIEFINSLFEKRKKAIHYKKKFDQIELNINQAIPVGLICNELLINANQHDFMDEVEEPFIKVELYKNEDLITFRIQNNGVMKDDLFDLSDPDSLDSHIIDALTRQVEGEVSHTIEKSLKIYTLTFTKGTRRGAASYIHPKPNE